MPPFGTLDPVGPFQSSMSRSFGISPSGNRSPNSPSITGAIYRSGGETTGYVAPFLSSNFNGPGPVGSAPRLPATRFANAASGAPASPSMISSAPSATGAPSYPVPRIAGDAPNMTPGQISYNTSHSPNWLGGLDRQRRQTATAQGTFAAARANGVDAPLAGQQAYAASHGIDATGGQQTNPPVIGDFKELEGVHQARIKAAQWEYEQASKNFDAAGKQSAMDRYHQATNDLDQLHQQHLGIAPGGAGTIGGAPSMFPSPAPSASSAPGMYSGSPSPNPSLLTGGSGPQQAPTAPNFSSPSSIGPAPSVPAHSALPPGSPGAAPTPEGSKGQIGITEATARQMWKNVVGQSGVDPSYLANVGHTGGPDMQTDRTFNQLRSQFAQTVGKYGISPTMADSLLGRWQEAGNLHQFDVTETTPPKTNPPPRIPISMLGTDTGMERYGPQSAGPLTAPGSPFMRSMQRESVPGPTVSPAATVTPAKTTTRPMPGNKIIRRPDAAPQQQQAGGGSTPQGTPMQLQNGRTVFLGSDGNYRDEQNRLIR